MLALKINGQSLDLSNDISITMNYSSPIFNTIGEHTYPFKLPATARNMSILNFKHRVENSSDSYQEFDAMLEYDGMLLIKGSLRVIRAFNEVYEATLYMDKGDFYYRRKNVGLEDFDYGELDFSNEAGRLNYMNDCVDTVYPERNITFPQILNKSYFEELPVNSGLHYFNIYINSAMIIGMGSPYERYLIVPMLYVRFVLKKIFEQLGYTLDDRFFSLDSDYNSLGLFNMVDCNCGEYGYFLYPTNKLLLNYHIPHLKLNDFFTGLETFFNIKFFVNTLQNTVKLASVDKIIKSGEYIEFSPQILSISIETEDQINGYYMKMAMDTDDDLYKDRKALDEERLKHMKTSVQSLSDLKPWPANDVMDLRYVMDREKYYILWTDKQWMEWYATVDLYLEYIYRTNHQSVETKFSTLLNNKVGDDAVVGNKQTAWKDITGKLFFVKWNESNPAMKRMIAVPSTDNNSLYFGGENGIFNKQYKAYFDFRMKAKPVKILKQMDLIGLRDLDFSKKYMINGTKYLLSVVQVAITNKGLKPATITAYTCN